MFYACLAARIPYEGESPGDVLMAHLQKPPPKLPDKQLQPVLDQAMAKQPAARFQTAGELAAAAAGAAAGDAVPAAPAPRPTRTRSGRATRR
ncbi:MAG TPA: hypothetical protein VH231_16180 [Solirubrobacteraceae bacterium]|nr:hypothetical protein [Solirubrobacteraceae bacterium]